MLKVSSYLSPNSVISSRALTAFVELPILVCRYFSESAWNCPSLMLSIGETLLFCSMNSTVPGVLDNLDHCFVSSRSSFGSVLGSTPSDVNPLNLGIGSCVTNLCTVVFVFFVKDCSGFIPFCASSTSPSSLGVIPTLSVVSHSGPHVGLAPVELKCTCAPARCIAPPAPCSCCPGVKDDNPSLA